MFRTVLLSVENVTNRGHIYKTILNKNSSSVSDRGNSDGSDT